MTEEEKAALAADFTKLRIEMGEEWWMNFLLGVALMGITEGTYTVS